MPQTTRAALFHRMAWVCTLWQLNLADPNRWRCWASIVFSSFLLRFLRITLSITLLLLWRLWRRFNFHQIVCTYISILILSKIWAASIILRRTWTSVLSLTLPAKCTCACEAVVHIRLQYLLLQMSVFHNMHLVWLPVWHFHLFLIMFWFIFYFFWENSRHAFMLSMRTRIVLPLACIQTYKFLVKLCMTLEWSVWIQNISLIYLRLTVGKKLALTFLWRRAWRFSFMLFAEWLTIFWTLIWFALSETLHKIVPVRSVFGGLGRLCL